MYTARPEGRPILQSGEVYRNSASRAIRNDLLATELVSAIP